MVITPAVSCKIKSLHHNPSSHTKTKNHVFACFTVCVRVRGEALVQRCVRKRYAVLLSTGVDGGFGGGVGGVTDVCVCCGGLCFGADLDT